MAEQLKISLPTDLRERLEAASAASGFSLAAEIRERLKWTFADDLVDKPTRELREAVLWIADELSRQVGAFGAYSPRGREALGQAIQHWLEITTPPPTGAASDLFGPDDPATLGRSIARTYQHFKAAVEQSTKSLRLKHMKGGKS
jgi:hypothetical protein